MVIKLFIVINVVNIRRKITKKSCWRDSLAGNTRCSCSTRVQFPPSTKGSSQPWGTTAPGMLCPLLAFAGIHIHNFNKVFFFQLKKKIQIKKE